MKYICVRIYPNGEIKYSIRDLEGMKSWVSYNYKYRCLPLFVNSRHIKRSPKLNSNLNIENITNSLKNENIFIKKHVRDNIGGLTGYRFGYEDDLIYRKSP